MKVSGAIITGLVVCFLFMFLGCSETPTSLEDQKANLETLNKYGVPGGGGGETPEEGDDDSDRPDYAGPDPTEPNPHKNPNPNPQDKRGEDYGDLFIIERDDSGAPETVDLTTPEGDQITVVQPVAFYLGTDDLVITDDDGIPIEATLDGTPEGEVVLYSYDPIDGVWMEPSVVLPEYVNEVPVKELTTCEVDFGRINLVRAPSARLTQALGEVLVALDPELRIQVPDNPIDNIRAITVDFCGRLTAVYNQLNLETTDVLDDYLMKTIDSPRESMAIYRELIEHPLDGGELHFLFEDNAYFFNEAPNFSIDDGDLLDIAASAFAAGSDKTGYVCIDEIVYCNTFLNLNDFSYYHNYNYDRSVYADRLIKMYWPDTGPNENPTAISITDAADLNEFKFNDKWNDDPSWTNVAGFRTAVDDAVQVLEFIHGDSNIEYVWPWEDL